MWSLMNPPRNPQTMLDLEQLKRDLIASGKLSAERLAEAERVAREQGVSLAEALISRLMISFPDLGASCARVTGLPYVPLMQSRPSSDTPHWLSMEFASRASVYPVRYDPREHLLTVAIHDPDQAGTLQRMLDFLLQDARLQFTIAPDVEITRACERARQESKPWRGEIAATTRARLMRTGGAPADAAAAATSSTGAPHDGAAPGNRGTQARNGSRVAAGRNEAADPAYAEMSQALIGVATFLVRQAHGEAPEQLHAVRTRVRYCQLMAARLKLSPVQTDALVLAAWFSALGRGEAIASQITTPYRLEEILAEGEGRGARPAHPRMEALILSLVRCYQDLKTGKPEVCSDVNMTRRELFLHWSAAQDQQSMLETFLQILVDEEFLDKLGRSAGRVLIVDPEELALCTLAPPLISMGYDVIAMPDTRSARGILEEFKPDLILVNVDSQPDRALWFCEKIKGDARTAGIRILAVVDGRDPQLPIKCLRAGANDFLSKPVHAELLFLKVQSHLSAVGVEVKESGVSGSIEEMSFTDMIQILSAGRRSVDLLINTDRDEGRVYIRDGDVVHATLGEMTGEAAFFALMQWKAGTFTTRQCGQLPERTIEVSTMALLMEGSRQADEKPEPPAA